MARKTKVFISYKTGLDNGLTGTASAIREHLANNGYDVWMDEYKLEAGEDWDTQIYDAISKMDVVVLLLAPETAASDWVRREIDVARGAHVFVLPVVIRDKFDFGKALEQFGIPRTQAIKAIKLSDEEKKKLRDSIESLSKKTSDAQKEWMGDLRTLRLTHKAQSNNPYLASYEIVSERKICLASGDMTEVSGIDVLVNTENNYMQMARIYEGTVLSSALRREGSYIDKGKVIEDTVQLELDQQVTKNKSFGSRPIEMEQVIPTHAGHAESALVKKGGRYIFHASTVYVHPRNRSVTPIRNESIKQTVLNCLELVMEINKNLGVISPAGTETYEHEQAASKTYTPIKSIIFPLFGAGQGGSPTSEVAPQMLDCFQDFLMQHKNTKGFSLESIHLCAFTEVDVAIVKKIMDEKFKS